MNDPIKPDDCYSDSAASDDEKENTPAQLRTEIATIVACIEEREAETQVQLGALSMQEAEHSRLLSLIPQTYVNNPATGKFDSATQDSNDCPSARSMPYSKDTIAAKANPVFSALTSFDLADSDLQKVLERVANENVRSSRAQRDFTKVYCAMWKEGDEANRKLSKWLQTGTHQPDFSSGEVV